MLLRSRGRLTARQLAEALEVHPRSVYRYIDALGAAGVPVVAEPGPGGGYRLAPGFDATPLFFAPEELAALSLAAQALRATGHPAAEALGPALGRLRHALTPDQVARVDAALEVLDLRLPRRDRPAPALLAALADAARRRQVVRVRYRKPGGEPEPRVVEPHRLAWREGAWYLVAWDRDRGARRDFRADRIEALEATGETFACRGDLAATDDDPARWVPRRLAAARRRTVRLRPHTPAARVALAEHWYLRHALAGERDGVLTFRLDPIGYRHLRSHLLGFGTDVTVVSPPALRRAVARLAAATARHHGGGPA